VDNLRNLARVVAPWSGFFLYLGRLYPRTADSRDSGGADPCDPGSAAGPLNLAPRIASLALGRDAGYGKFNLWS
jgi:hypothetical protein